MSQPKADQKVIATVDRQRQAVELRKAGMGYQEISDQLGYKDASGSYRAVRAALKAAVREPARELIALEVARLDDMLKGIWVEARKGNVSKLDRVLKIMERRATLLGLDAPKTWKDLTDPRKDAEAIAAEIGKPELADQIHQDLLLSQEAR